MRRERIMNELRAAQQEQTVDEEQKIAKVVAEQHAKQAQQRRDEEEKRAAMLKSIAAYRELKVTRVAAVLVQSHLGGVLCGVITSGLKNLNLQLFDISNTNCVSPETRQGAEGQNSKAKCPRCTEGQERG